MTKLEDFYAFVRSNPGNYEQAAYMANSTQLKFLNLDFLGAEVNYTFTESLNYLSQLEYFNGCNTTHSFIYVDPNKVGVI